MEMRKWIPERIQGSDLITRYRNANPVLAQAEFPAYVLFAALLFDMAGVRALTPAQVQARGLSQVALNTMLTIQCLPLDLQHQFTLTLIDHYTELV
jgi:hypothetical protein